MATGGNIEVLRDFVAYCEANPSMRFWQALANWAGIPYLLCATTKDIGSRDCRWWDTWYWEGRTLPPDAKATAKSD